MRSFANLAAKAGTSLCKTRTQRPAQNVSPLLGTSTAFSTHSMSFSLVTMRGKPNTAIGGSSGWTQRLTMPASLAVGITIFEKIFQIFAQLCCLSIPSYFANNAFEKLWVFAHRLWSCRSQSPAFSYCLNQSHVRLCNCFGKLRHLFEFGFGIIFRRIFPVQGCAYRNKQNEFYRKTKFVYRWAV